MATVLIWLLLLVQTATTQGTEPSTLPNANVVCIFPISGQYDFLQRLLVYNLLTLAVVNHRAEWLRRGSLAAAITYSSSACVHAVVIAIVSRNDQVFDLDIIGVYSIISSSIIILGPMLDWCRPLHHSIARPIIRVWGVLVSVGLVCAFIALRRPYPQEKPCIFHTAGLLLTPSQLATQDFDYTCPGFDTSSPLRPHSEPLVIASDRVLGSWFDILKGFLITSIVLMSLTILSIFAHGHGDQLIIKDGKIHQGALRPGFGHACTTFSLNVAKSRPIDVLFAVVAPIAFLANIIMVEFYVMKWSALPVDENFFAIGQWSP